jgi:hypothetical protein
MIRAASNGKWKPYSQTYKPLDRPLINNPVQPQGAGSGPQGPTGEAGRQKTKMLLKVNSEKHKNPKDSEKGDIQAPLLRYL